MELFRCVFISLVAFLSAVKVQSRKVSLSFAGQSTGKTVCHGVDNYLQAVCSANKSSQCEARADGDSKKNANSTFQLLHVKTNGIRYTCIQFTHPNTGAKYALKVVNQSGVVFETYQGCNVTTPNEFLFVQELGIRDQKNRYFRYKPYDNPSMCLGKDNCTLSLVNSGTDKYQRPCLFKRCMETVSRRLLQQMARMDMDRKVKKPL